ncbi:MAG: rod shape-determining protein MreD [Chlorobiaceae bacterium]|nr:rod shape-determining protein MreD [Chlorobiaceae bacterium]
MAVLAVIQHFIFSRVVILGASPDILAVFIAYVSVIIGQRTGIVFGFSAGLIAGFLSGNPGLAALIGTVEGFTAGFFHVSPDSHPTMVKKRRMFYSGAATSIAAGNLFQALLSNPLALPAWVRIPSMVILGTLSSMFLAVLIYQLALKRTLRD